MTLYKDIEEYWLIGRFLCCVMLPLLKYTVFMKDQNLVKKSFKCRADLFWSVFEVHMFYIVN